LEKERGITILSKNTAITWNNYRINIVDTPGHADFGGEVERVLSMVDSVLLLIDAVEGPMPQTRFVTQKAFDHGLRPIVVVNKIDRDGARAHWAVDQVFDLFDRLGASDEQLDFPVVYASAVEGYATLDVDQRTEDMTVLFEAIVEHAPEPDVDVDAPFQMQISSIDYSSFVGAIGVGRVRCGKIKTNTPIALVDSEGKTRNARILQIMGFHGLKRVEVDTAQAGDIIAVTGIERISISDTLCDRDHPAGLPPLVVDQPTVTMMFQVNTSPFCGQDGKYVTSRQLLERLERELIHNVALRVTPTANPDIFEVAGRGELHLSILLETIRREGYEIAVSRAHVIYREIDGVRCEPFEDLSVDVEEEHQGGVMKALGARKGDLRDMTPDGRGRVRLSYYIPARGLIG
ncbi:MAG: GTP-binding protein, partial [Methylococcales bacterium]|nr:GTP-binding protein [Methylococcales bacterium]